MAIDLQKFSDRATMVAGLADNITARLQDSVLARGAASLVVSGGTTPKALFEVLALRDLPWQKITVSLADERWVDAGSPDSNEHLVRTSLLSHNAAAAKFVPLKNNAPTPAAGENACDAALKKIPSPFDVLLLGIGDDGHTASLFPQADGLKEAMDMNSGRQCKAVTPQPLPVHAPYPRMTLTLPRLLDSRWIAFLITGSSKLDVLEKAVAGGNIRTMPVTAVLQQNRTPVSVFWAP